MQASNLQSYFLGWLLFRYGLELLAWNLGLARLRNPHLKSASENSTSDKRLPGLPEQPPTPETSPHAQTLDRVLKYQGFKGLLRSFEDGLVLLVTSAILGGGMEITDQIARRNIAHPVVRGLCVVGTLIGLRGLLGWPFTIARTFWLEARFGFNRTTLKTFLSDQILVILIGAFLGTIVLGGTFGFFFYFDRAAWWMGWIAYLVFQLALSYLAPAFLLPLFNRLSPLPEGELREAVQRYAATRQFDLEGIYLMDGSRRSSKANAFFTGFGRFRKLVLLDTLLSQHPIRELIAVLAHEVGHYKLRHIERRLALSALNSLIVFYALGVGLHLPTLIHIFGFRQESVYASILSTFFILIPLFDVLGWLSLALSRRDEFAADAFARRTLGHPEDLIAALWRMSLNQLSQVDPHPLQVMLGASHPPVRNRILALSDYPVEASRN